MTYKKLGKYCYLKRFHIKELHSLTLSNFYIIIQDIRVTLKLDKFSSKNINFYLCYNS